MAELRTMLGLLAILWVLLFPGRLAGIRLEQPALVVARSGSSVTLSCRANTKVSYIHWYQHQEGNAPRRLLIVALFSSYVQTDSVLKGDKVTARRGSDGKSCNLLMSKLEKSDEAVYYCTAWEGKRVYDWNNKVFGPGTHLRVTDKSPNEDISPKPTIFLPSVAEKRLHDAGTYLCLLEDFFPDIIKIDWQEKDGKRILTSQQGDTMKTKDTYMKFSWLTVTGASLDKDHKCIVTHKNNKGGVDQEILFPSIKKGLVAMMGSKVDFQGHPETRAPKTGVVTVSPLRSLSLSPFSRAIERTAINFTKDSLKEEKAALQLQLTNTSAYYTHVLLLVKSLVYSAIMAVCLLRRPALCGSGTSS